MFDKRCFVELGLRPTPFVPKCGIETAAIIGIGTAIAAVASSTAGAFSQASTNRANLEATENANQTNVALQNSTNQTNKQLAKEANETNIQLQREMNEYNSIGSQLERGREAGVNPNTILGGNVSGNIQTTLPKVSPASFVSPMIQAFNQSQNPMKDYSQQFQQIAQGFSGLQENVSKVTNIDWDSKLKEIESKWSDITHSWNLDLTKQNIRTLAGQEQQAFNSAMVMRQTGRQLIALTSSIKLDNFDKVMRNIFSHDLYRFGTEKLQSEVFSNFMSGNQAQTASYVAMAMLPANLGLARAQTKMFISQGKYFDALESLTPENRSLLTSLAGLYQAQSANTWLDTAFQVDSYALRLAGLGLHNQNTRAQTRMYNTQAGLNFANTQKARQETEKLKFENSTVYRFMQLNEMFAKSAMMYGSAYSDFTGGTGIGSLMKGSTKIGF